MKSTLASTLIAVSCATNVHKYFAE